MKLEIGQTLYLETKHHKVKPVYVKKIGSLYFEVSGFRETMFLPFNVNTLKYESRKSGQIDIQLFISRKALVDKIERTKTLKVLKEYFASDKCNSAILNKLIDVKYILGI